MRVLLATPWFSEHLDAGLMWASALGQLGHDVVLWDHRAEPDPPRLLCAVALVMKGDETIAAKLRPRTPNVVAYWPDWLDRTPGLLERLLQAYDVVATPQRPTPEGCMWLPTGWDPQVHTRFPSGYPDPIPSMAFGTGTPRKAEFLASICPTWVLGNDWDSHLRWKGSGFLPAAYGPRLVGTLSQAQVLVNVHRDAVGVNRRLFEMMACGFTLTDIVPGVEEVLGPDLTRLVGFATPQEGRAQLLLYLDHPEQREALWQREHVAIQPYSYKAAAARLLQHVLA